MSGLNFDLDDDVALGIAMLLSMLEIAVPIQDQPPPYSECMAPADPEVTQALLFTALVDRSALAPRGSPEHIIGDGNCGPRAIADLVFGDQNNYNKVREDVVVKIVCLFNNNQYCGQTLVADYIKDEYTDILTYMRRMTSDGCYFSTMEIEAASMVYKCNFRVLDGASRRLMYQTGGYGIEHTIYQSGEHFYC